jgi:hypothetical protein
VLLIRSIMLHLQMMLLIKSERQENSTATSAVDNGPTVGMHYPPREVMIPEHHIVTVDVLSEITGKLKLVE